MCGTTMQQSGYGYKAHEQLWPLTRKSQCIISFTRVKIGQVITYIISEQKFGAHTRKVIIVVIKRPADERLGYKK